MLRESSDLSPIAWISENRRPIETDPAKWDGNFVANCVPPVYPAYCKVFHAIYEDLTIGDRKLSWNDVKDKRAHGSDPVEKLLSDSKAVYGGDFSEHDLRRIRWETLANRYSLQYHPEINADTFSRNFPGGSWPRYLIGPDEGFLDDQSCREIVRTIGFASNDLELSQECYFYYWLLATQSWETDLLFEGKLIDVFEAANLNSVRGTPTNWWCKDRSWFVCSDYDLTFTLIGADNNIVDDLVSNPALECVRVEATTRVDNLGDRINPQ